MVTGYPALEALLPELFHLIGSLPSQLCIFILGPGNVNHEVWRQRLPLVFSLTASALGCSAGSQGPDEGPLQQAGLQGGCGVRDTGIQELSSSLGNKSPTLSGPHKSQFSQASPVGLFW